MFRLTIIALILGAISACRPPLRCQGFYAERPQEACTVHLATRGTLQATEFEIIDGDGIIESVGGGQMLGVREGDAIVRYIFDGQPDFSDYVIRVRPIDRALPRAPLNPNDWRAMIEREVVVAGNVTSSNFDLLLLSADGERLIDQSATMSVGVANAMRQVPIDVRAGDGLERRSLLRIAKPDRLIAGPAVEDCFFNVTTCFYAAAGEAIAVGGRVQVDNTSPFGPPCLQIASSVRVVYDLSRDGIATEAVHFEALLRGSAARSSTLHCETPIL